MYTHTMICLYVYLIEYIFCMYTYDISDEILYMYIYIYISVYTFISEGSGLVRLVDQTSFGCRTSGINCAFTRNRDWPQHVGIKLICYIYIYTCIYTCRYIHIYLYIYICKYIYIYIYMNNVYYT